MKLSSWEAASRSANEEMPNIPWNTKVYWNNPRSPPIILGRRQINSLHTTPFYFSKIHFNIVLPHVSKIFLVLSFLVAFPWSLTYISHFSRACYMLCPCRSTLIFSFYFLLVKSTGYEDPHYAVLFSHLSLHASSLLTFFLTYSSLI
jgi:hypothetical protein